MTTGSPIRRSFRERIRSSPEITGKAQSSRPIFASKPLLRAWSKEAPQQSTRPKIPDPPGPQTGLPDRGRRHQQGLRRALHAFPHFGGCASASACRAVVGRCWPMPGTEARPSLLESFSLTSPARSAPVQVCVGIQGVRLRAANVTRVWPLVLAMLKTRAGCSVQLDNDHRIFRRCSICRDCNAAAYATRYGASATTHQATQLIVHLSLAAAPATPTAARNDGRAPLASRRATLSPRAHIAQAHPADTIIAWRSSSPAKHWPTGRLLRAS
ncbi:hypothetical protein SAMN02990966_07325 [Rhodospirillales bacterium URHD0017]|nr:hypothetical protein SAMN02990966_07325 [Rhodospirillales bacterium URHD0017]